MPTELSDLIAALSRPEAYPHPVGSIEVHQTHISVVFLAGDFAYKIKKPVKLDFVDFSTLEKRKHFCEEEVRLNRRLAPDVYLGVVPVHSSPLPLGEGPGVRGEHSLHCGPGPGAIVEYAVQMRRLPADATLEQRLAQGEVTAEQIRALARRVAAFHRDTERNAHIAAFGRFAVVVDNARGNFTAGQIGEVVSRAVHARVRALTESSLDQHRALIESRAAHGVPRDTHGDLHLDHVYLFPDAKPPLELVIIDCIEFADRFRFADPVADMAFLAMDLAFHGRRDLARTFADEYFAAGQDTRGRELLPFYAAYRALVRAKVEAIELADEEIDAAEHAAARQRARAHWLVALGELEEPSRRPALVVIAGLPGSGKSTLARALAEKAHGVVLRSDVIRKELGADYSDAASERTYAEMLRRAEAELWQGERVIVDANFRADALRLRFLDAAQRWGVPLLFVHCTAPSAMARARLEARRNDASDADWSVYERLANSWQPLSGSIARVSFHVDSALPVDENVQRIVKRLAEDELA